MYQRHISPAAVPIYRLLSVFFVRYIAAERLTDDA